MGLQSGEIPFGRGNASLLWCHNMGEDKCTLYKNPAFLLGKHHFLVYKREVELQVNIRKMDQSCVSLLSGRVGGISLKAGTQCLSRLRRARSTFSRLRRSLQKQAKNFLKTGSHRSASDLKKKNMEYRKGSKPGNSQAWSLTVIGKNPPLLFCRFRFANSYMQWTHGARLQKHLRNRHGTMLHWTCNVFRAYGGNHGSKPQLWRVPFHKGNPTEAISQSDAQRLFAPTAFPKKALIQS